MYNKLKISSSLLFVGLVACLFILPSDSLLAQGASGLTNKVIGRAKSKARAEVRKEVGGISSSAKNTVKGSKGGLKRSLKGGVASGRGGGSDLTLDELIEDPEAKQQIADRNNKQRFVKLFREWWTLPSEQELRVRARLQAIRDSLAQIDSSQFRVPRMIYDGSRPMVVYGWHAHWMGGLYKTYDYSIVNVISYYSYDINPYSGASRNPKAVQDFVQSDFVSNAQASDCGALLSISLHGEDNVATFLDQNPIAQQTLMDSLIYLLDTTNADGIEINFQGVTDYYKDDFMKFVRVLSHNLTGARGDTCFLFMTVPAYDPENVYDLTLLEPFVDMFIIGGYHLEETPRGLFKMPTAPLNYNPMSTEYDLRKAVDKYVANIGPLQSGRLILGLPYFGSKWETQGNEDVLLGYLSYNEVMFDHVMQDWPSDTVEYDSSRAVHIWRSKRQEDSTALPIETIIYYDDAQSLARKYDFIINSRLGGVGIWSLGYDSGFEHLGNVLKEKFTDVEIPDNEQLAMVKKASETSQTFGVYALTILFYIGIFMACGFCMALFNVQIRQTLFTNGSFRLYYLGFFTLLILILGGYLGLFEGTTSTLVFGVILGSVVSWLGLRLINRQHAKQP